MRDKHFCTEFLEKKTKPDSSNFILDPTNSVLNFDNYMEFVDGNHSFLSMLLLLPAFWGSSGRLISFLGRESK